MPIEFITVHVHSVIESVGPDWAVDASVYTDNDPHYDVGEDGPRIYVPDAFWDNAKVTNPGDDDVRLYYLADVGGIQLAGIFGAHTANVDLTDEVGNEGTMDWIKSDYQINNPPVDTRLYWSVLEGQEMPSFVRITSDWTYEFEHHYGIDADVPLGPYTFRDVVSDLEEESEWEAPLMPGSVNDNDLYVGAVAHKGHNWDVGEPEVGVELFTIAVYQRVITTGAITGQYLGADRRFMGF